MEKEVNEIILFVIQQQFSTYVLEWIRHNPLVIF